MWTGRASVERQRALARTLSGGFPRSGYARLLGVLALTFPVLTINCGRDEFDLLAIEPGSSGASPGGGANGQATGGSSAGESGRGGTPHVSSGGSSGSGGRGFGGNDPESGGRSSQSGGASPGITCDEQFRCPDKLKCYGGQCVECIPGDPAGCSPYHICDFFRCIPACDPGNNDRSCAPGKVCHPERRVCLECLNSNHCSTSASGPYCCFDACGSWCCFDGQCGEGQVCRSGVCKLPQAQP